jgi:hypothetical protein
MIKINLLPVERRKKRPVFTFQISQVKFIIIGIAFIAILVVSFVLISGWEMKTKSDLSKAKREHKVLQNDPEIIAVKNQINDIGVLKAKIKVIKNLIEKRFIWSKALYDLKSEMPENLWYRSIGLGKAVGKDKKESPALIIKGSVVGEEGLKIIADFYEILKRDEFFRSFEDIDLADVSLINDIKKIYNFTFTLIFKEGVL